MARLTIRQFSSREDAEAHYLAQVDLRAEECRAKYLTPGAGQAMTYEQKYREALAGAGLLLQAEAEALEMTVAEVAQSVIAAHALWQQEGSRIEAARLKAKKRIREATTAAEMHAAVKALDFA